MDTIKTNPSEAVPLQRLDGRAACNGDMKQEWWAVAVKRHRDGKLRVAEARYEDRVEAEIAAGAHAAVYNEFAFLVVAVWADESSEDVKQRLTSSPNGAAARPEDEP
jgi:hypothetical protein